MKKLLIVEDQADVRKLLEVIFGTKGYRLWGGNSGEEGVELARQVKPDVILLDVMLPGELDGYEVTRTLKNDPATAGCAIIIMTAKVQEKDRTEAFEAGADDYIGKPFNLGELIAKVGKFIE